MFRTWLRRYLGLGLEPPPVDHSRVGLERRVDELEQHVDFLRGALRKLRGRVTGSIRNGDLPAGDGEAVSDAPPSQPALPFSRQWELAQLAKEGMNGERERTR